MYLISPFKLISQGKFRNIGFLTERLSSKYYISIIELFTQSHKLGVYNDVLT